MSSLCGEGKRTSSIKGGGRVELTPEMEDAIVDFLRTHRDPKNPLLPLISSIPEEESDHDAAHKRKRFLKRLAACHDRQQLCNNLNKQTPEISKQEPSRSHLSGTNLGKGGKVRLDVVEAVYKKDNPKWTASSSRKTLVLERSTCIQELLRQAQSKLKVKKTLVRAFVLDKQSNLEMDLTNDLEGVENGSLLYVTEHVGSTSAGGKQSEEEEQDELPYPLDAVKEVYKRRLFRLKGHRNASVPFPTTFSEHLGKLEDLSPSRASLPAASFREKILQAVDRSRVVIISGSTGCGKVSSHCFGFVALYFYAVDLLMSPPPAHSRVSWFQSTQIPQYLLEGMIAAGNGDQASICVTQPRRVAAMSLAERVAKERQSAPPGKADSLVGYHVRLGRAIDDNTTRIVYCTVGILLRKLTDPRSSPDEAAPLADISHVVIDEIHERDINTDFCLTLIRHVLAVNKTLKVILMSATADPTVFINYFQSTKFGIHPEVLAIPGRTFPVTSMWLSDIEKLVGSKVHRWRDTIEDGDSCKSTETLVGAAMLPRALEQIDNLFICRLISKLVTEQERSGVLGTPNSGKRQNGAILVFMPGKSEIGSLASALRNNQSFKNCNLLDIFSLHSSVPKSQQKDIFRLGAAGRVKVVIATNIAETSITIPDISVVIDTGRSKESRFNSSTRTKELITVWISRDSSTQRAGRAGRTGPGTCFRLYSEEFANIYLPESTSPEILRTPLDELVLQVCLLDEARRDKAKRSDDLGSNPLSPGTVPMRFLRQTPSPPPAESLANACDHLVEIGALRRWNSDLEHCVQLTPLGYHLSQLPMDAKIGKAMIVGSILGCIDPALTVAAALSSTKSCWRNEHDVATSEKKKTLVENGFGGFGWSGGTVKGDIIASVAAYNAWRKMKSVHKQIEFARVHGLDINVLQEMKGLREQYRDLLLHAGFVDNKTDWNGPANDNAALTSCCLVAGLYPNVATLVRPVRGKLGFRGGRLLTKEGDICLASSGSFQSARLRNVSETGRDAYAVYHAKLVMSGTNKPGELPGKKRVLLSEVNFVSRFAILLFAGDLEVKDNFIVVEGWLKFKVGDKGRTTAILIKELRQELDDVLLRKLQDDPSKEADETTNSLLSLVSKMLCEE
jgi:HrpA-like RNA helicase